MVLCGDHCAEMAVLVPVVSCSRPSGQSCPQLDLHIGKLIRSGSVISSRFCYYLSATCLYVLMHNLAYIRTSTFNVFSVFFNVSSNHMLLRLQIAAVG